MGSGFGPLVENLYAIKYQDPVGIDEPAEYHLGSCWTSAESFVEIVHDTTDFDNGRLLVPTPAAVKIAAAILYSKVYDGDIGPAELLTDALVGEDQAAFRRVLQRILADELKDNTNPPPPAVELDDTTTERHESVTVTDNKRTADLINDLRRAAKAMVDMAVEATMAEQANVHLSHDGVRAIADLMFDAGWKLKLAQLGPSTSQPLPTILRGDDDKPIRDFLQLDGWANREPGDAVMVPDDDGDVLMGGFRQEPQRSGTTVRIWVAEGAERDDVVRIIHKQLAWYEERWAGPVAERADDEPPF
ncbi:MAG: hypothetical protein AB7G47_04640 [Mycolicibacterium sp.]|uniref:hypothetical protein n=1 Tax=Mycolicibacterium sp. TaxID=2320850 RepID=UPI003D0B6507